MITAKKVFLAGIGFLSLGAKKMEAMFHGYGERGSQIKDDGEKAFKELMDEAGKSKAEVSARVKKEIKNIVSKMDLATKDDIENLIKKIKELEEKISNETKQD